MLQQDNAHPNTARNARAVKAFLDQEHIQTLPWLAFSPNMCPTEHAWEMLGRHFHQG
uniref:Tc1-like transposase DDE domain-containing protein n=1 Tax=Oreochromis niloticus TaxID=8128 RepID=A0A669E8Z9_ORENI